MSVSRRWKNRLIFWCPGCETDHAVPVVGMSRWEWNNDLERPTLSPSLLTTVDLPDNKSVCHLFLRDGQIQFLADCTHKLAGQTVPLEEEQ